MPLFVVLAAGVDLDAALIAGSTPRSAPSFRSATSQTRSSRPRPIPRTLTGKKMEVPVKRLFLGRPLAEVAAPGATADPDRACVVRGICDRMEPSSALRRAMMGFLRRGGRKGEPVPDWASYFTEDEYNAFLKVLKADLDRRGLPHSIGDGFVRITGSGNTYGLTNLAQLCHSTDRQEWPGLVASHFTTLEISAARDIDAVAAEFEQIKTILRVRLLADETMGGMSAAQLAGSRPYVSGILLALVYDFPDFDPGRPAAAHRRLVAGSRRGLADRDRQRSTRA